jgi:pyruvate dehydrogenase E1 component alpha subunit
MTRQATSTDLPGETLLGLFRTMLRIRRFEEKVIEVYGAQDMKTPVHLCIGQEAIAAGVCAALRKDDYIFSTHRSHGHCLAKGADPKPLYAEFYGRVTGCCKGKAGSMHPAFPELGILGTSAIVGGGIPHAVGTALASKMRGDGRVSVTFFGDGASEEGTFHESLNFASLHRLPVVFVCENNLFATHSPISARQPNEDIHRKAASYDMPGACVDGNDVAAVHVRATEAVRRARDGAGPTLIECKTYRWRGHVGPEDDHERGFRPKELLVQWKPRCPVERCRKTLLGRGLLTEQALHEMLAEIDAELDAAIRFAKESSFPPPEDVCRDVYAE